MAEPRSLAEDLFSQIMGDDPPARAAFLRTMVGSSPPTFEEEWLDFKSGVDGPLASAKPLSDQTIKQLWSTALSGFANTGGGVLIWGIDARPTSSVADSSKKIDAAADLRLVPNPDAFKSQLMTLHHVATDPPVGGIRVEPVYDDAASGGFVVCFVPESANKPHRAELVTNKPYFVRFGDDFVIMPAAVLRSMFFPHGSPRYAVRIACWGANLHNPHVATINFRIAIRNRGNVTAVEPYVVVQLDPRGYSNQLYRDEAWRQISVNDGEGFNGTASIHPGATAPAIIAHFGKEAFEATKRIVVTCTVHSLNASPKKFSTAFDVDGILHGTPSENDADELPD